MDDYNLFINLNTPFQKNARAVKSRNLNVAFKKFVRLNKGFYNNIDLLKPVGLAYNKFSDRIVNRSVVYTKKGTIRAKFQKPLPPPKKDPRIKEVVVVDEFQSFKQTRYFLENVTTLNQLYNIIKKQINDLPQGGNAKLFFKSRINGNTIFRTIVEVNLLTFEDFQDFIDAIFQGSNEGSGGVDAEEYDLFLDMFDITETLIGGDGKPNNIFKCKEIKTGSCYRDVLDYIEEKTHTVEPENKKCLKCGLKCVPCWSVKDVPFWGCTKCRERKDLKTFPTFQHAMNDDDKNRYMNANPKFRNLDQFIQRIETIETDRKVKIYANSYTIKQKVGTRNIKKQTPIVCPSVQGIVSMGKTVSKIAPTKKDVFYPLNMKKFPEIQPYEIYRNNAFILNSPVNIVFDCYSEHYDIIDTEEIEFIDNLYLSGRGYTCVPTENNSMLPIFAPKHLNKQTHKKQTYERKRLFWDVETVMDRESKNVMIPYSISFCALNDEYLETVEELDNKKDNKKLSLILKSRTQCIVGYDCIIKFIKWILKTQKGIRYELVSFNGSCFDHFLLLDALLDTRNNFGEECNVDHIFYNGSSVLSLHLKNRHSVFDLARHVVGSLDSNCKGFKVNCVAKSSFNHHEAQKMHDNGTLIEFMTDNEELIDYNNRDVWSLAVIFKRYSLALSKQTTTEKYASDLCSKPTIGGMVWDIMNTHWRKFEIEQQEGNKRKIKKISFPKLNIEQYDAILKYKTAGRVQLFNGVQEVKESMCSKDIASMYPYVMACADVYYPCGEVVETEKYVKDKIGFYWCNIDQRILKEKNLPNIVAYKDYTKKKDGSDGALIGNDWAYDGIIKNYFINSVTIEHLMSNGCTVKIHKGIYFTDKAKSCDVFRPILDLMKTKIEQDLLKRSKDSEYNPSLRETCKLCMNSVSGKVIEGLHLEKVQEVDTEEFSKIIGDIKSGNGKIEQISAINMCGTKLFAELKLKQEDNMHKQRPVYLGALIYAYAQRHIYETGYKVIGLKDLVYTDTDSFKARASVFDRPDVKQYYQNAKVGVWDCVHKYDPTFKSFEKMEHPIYTNDSKVFGSYEEELPENTYSVFAQKKGYIIVNEEWYNKEHPEYSESLHLSFKGVPKKSILIESIDLEFLDKTTKNHNDGTTTVKYGIVDQVAAINYANENEDKQICNNAVKFAKQLYEKREAYVLTTSFRKIVKNSKMCDDLENTDKFCDLMHKVQVVAVLKKITIAK